MQQVMHLAEPIKKRNYKFIVTSNGLCCWIVLREVSLLWKCSFCTAEISHPHMPMLNGRVRCDGVDVGCFVMVLTNVYL